MRWFWIDRFTEFESGSSATAIKNVSLAEEHLHDHFPGVPLMPNSLIIEGIAQTGRRSPHRRRGVVQLMRETCRQFAQRGHFLELLIGACGLANAIGQQANQSRVDVGDAAKHLFEVVLVQGG